MNPTERRSRRRCALLAVLSWFGVPLLGQRDTPAAPVQSPVPTDAIRAVLQRLDRAFERADADAYLAEFAPDHPGAQEMLRQRLARMFDCGLVLRSRSSLVGEPTCVGPRTVVRVRQEIHAAPAAGAAGPGKQAVLVEDSMLALRLDAAAVAVPTFTVAIPADADARTHTPFRCPPCNYEIGGVDGWLCVPVRRDRALALEGASFYLMGTDLACDVSVRIDHDQPPATTVAERLGTALRQLDPGAEAGLACAWLPAAHAVAPPAALAGARIEVTLPADSAHRNGSRALFHVTAFGALQHLLLVRGSRTTMQRHDGQLQALLASFRMLETDCDRALAAARPLEHHTGGTLSAGVYRNDRFAIELTGPAGWKSEQRCGGAEFRVVWTSPTGSRLWLVGYGVPAGLPQWCRETAERWLADLCAAQGLEPNAAQPASAWARADECDALCRLATWVQKDGKAPKTMPERQLRMLLRDDVLIVLDGAIADVADGPALRAAMASIRRR